MSTSSEPGTEISGQHYQLTCCWYRNCCQWSAALLVMYLSSSKTVHQHMTLVTQSSFCPVKHPSSSVLTCQQSWPKSCELPCLGHNASACIASIISLYGQVAAVSCWNMNWMLAQHSGWCHWSLVKKDWKHVYLKFEVPCSCFHNCHFWEKNSLLSISWMSSRYWCDIFRCGRPIVWAHNMHMVKYELNFQCEGT